MLGCILDSIRGEWMREDNRDNAAIGDESMVILVDDGFAEVGRLAEDTVGAR